MGQGAYIKIYNSDIANSAEVTLGLFSHIENPSEPVSVDLQPGQSSHKIYVQADSSGSVSSFCLTIVMAEARTVFYFNESDWAWTVNGGVSFEQAVGSSDAANVVIAQKGMGNEDQVAVNIFSIPS